MTVAFKLFVGVLLLAAALLAPPAVVANVLAGATGLALLGTMTAAAPSLAPTLPPEAGRLSGPEPPRPPGASLNSTRERAWLSFAKLTGSALAGFIGRAPPNFLVSVTSKNA